MHGIIAKAAAAAGLALALCGGVTACGTASSPDCPIARTGSPEPVLDNRRLQPGFRRRRLRPLPG